MSVDQGLYDWVAEALAPMGSVTKRSMMGGATLYLDGVIFALIAEDQLWFKADKVSDAFWDGEDCARFTFDFGDGKMRGSLNYRRAPDDVYDDAETMQRFVKIAIEAGRRVPAKKQRPKQI